MSITVKDRIFLKDNQPFFFLADTCWSAFTNITLEDWEYYVRYRSNQGFNTIQINALPQWDASEAAFQIDPFVRNEDGTFQFGNVNEAYFERAEEMVKMAKDHGLTIALVLLWVNYLPNTWATKLRKTHHFPLDYVEEYVELIVDRFSKYNPMYLVSGDTDFPNEAIPYFEKAMRKIKELDPSGITTLHIQGRLAKIPKHLEMSPNLDFFMYQSGHNSQFQETAYTLAKAFYHNKATRPVVNGEPCYEQMGYSRQVYGRFTRSDVRRVAWQSVLSGAGAGITYGAHGIWSWHQAGTAFGTSLGEAFDAPYDWRVALRFEGAWDYAFLKEFIEDNSLFALEPKSIALNQTEKIRIATSGERLVAYVPHNTVLRLEGDFSDYDITAIELETRKTQRLTCQLNDNETHIQMHEFVGDCIYFLKK